jgi:hypothetical protein
MNTFSESAHARFDTHKGKGKDLNRPHAATATHYISMGVDCNLNVAMKAATAGSAEPTDAEKGFERA